MGVGDGDGEVSVGVGAGLEGRLVDRDGVGDGVRERGVSDVGGGSGASVWRGRDRSARDRVGRGEADATVDGPGEVSDADGDTAAGGCKCCDGPPRTELAAAASGIVVTANTATQRQRPGPRCRCRPGADGNGDPSGGVSWPRRPGMMSVRSMSEPGLSVTRAPQNGPTPTGPQRTSRPGCRGPVHA